MTERRLYRVQITNTVFFVSEPKFAHADARSAIRDAASDGSDLGELEIDEVPAGTPVKEIPNGWRDAYPYMTKDDEKGKRVKELIRAARKAETLAANPRQLTIEDRTRERT